MSKELLFSVSLKRDMEETHVRGSGPGGQHRNKSHTGVRLVHRASGAVGVATEHRSQVANRKAAFMRLIESREFRTWQRLLAAEIMMNGETAEAAVERSMQPQNLKVEIKDEQGRWINGCT